MHADLSARQRRRQAVRSSRLDFVLLGLLAVGLVALTVWLPTLDWYVYVLGFAVPIGGVLFAMMALRHHLEPLPALDRTPRQAVVAGRTLFRVDDPEMGPVELVTMTLDIDGARLESHLADRIADQSIDQFAIGSVWQVYAFAGPVTHGTSTKQNRVLLTEAHEDVYRCGYDLVSTVVTHDPGPGSDLLKQRFENDPEPPVHG